jgi:hypothetical protein
LDDGADSTSRNANFFLIKDKTWGLSFVQIIVLIGDIDPRKPKFNERGQRKQEQLQKWHQRERRRRTNRLERPAETQACGERGGPALWTSRGTRGGVGEEYRGRRGSDRELQGGGGSGRSSRPLGQGWGKKFIDWIGKMKKKVASKKV